MNDFRPNQKGRLLQIYAYRCCRSLHCLHYYYIPPTPSRQCTFAEPVLCMSMHDQTDESPPSPIRDPKRHGPARLPGEPRPMTTNHQLLAPTIPYIHTYTGHQAAESAQHRKNASLCSCWRLWCVVLLQNTHIGLAGVSRRRSLPEPLFWTKAV